MDVEGMVITADALHTQRETASQIVEGNKADYVFTVKGNQPTLLEEVELASASKGAFSPSV